MTDDISKREALDLRAARSAIALHKPTADEIYAGSKPDSVCRKCGDDMAVPTDLEPTALCNLCAQEVAGWLPGGLSNWQEAVDEVERLTKLHAEKHAQNERMCAEIERLDREVAKLRAQVTSYDALAVQAADTIDALSAACDRIATIADEAFGPLPVQPAEANLTAIEQGIAKQHSEIERRRALADGADLAVLALERDADQARAEIARLTAVINSGLAEVYG